MRRTWTSSPAMQGQTNWHLPMAEMFEGNLIKAHLEMAEISKIAAKTGVATLSQFRVSDLALGARAVPPLFVAWDSLCAINPTRPELRRYRQRRNVAQGRQTSRVCLRYWSGKCVNRSWSSGSRRSRGGGRRRRSWNLGFRWEKYGVRKGALSSVRISYFGSGQGGGQGRATTSRKGSGRAVCIAMI